MGGYIVTLTNAPFRLKGIPCFSIYKHVKSSRGYALHDPIGPFLVKPRSLKHFLIKSYSNLSQAFSISNLDINLWETLQILIRL